jgi:hypothetical protein
VEVDVVVVAHHSFKVRHLYKPSAAAEMAPLVAVIPLAPTAAVRPAAMALAAAWLDQRQAQELLGMLAKAAVDGIHREQDLLAVAAAVVAAGDIVIVVAATAVAAVAE